VKKERRVKYYGREILANGMRENRYRFRVLRTGKKYWEKKVIKINGMGWRKGKSGS
jgi:hypothetical protein